jgi:hypothetical protein
MESQAVTCPEGLKRAKNRICPLKCRHANDNKNGYRYLFSRQEEAMQKSAKFFRLSGWNERFRGLNPTGS